eukprot:6187434-Pleurochrysis_carterae.AAC.2
MKQALCMEAPIRVVCCSRQCMKMASLRMEPSKLVEVRSMPWNLRIHTSYAASSPLRAASTSLPQVCASGGVATARRRTREQIQARKQVQAQAQINGVTLQRKSNDNRYSRQHAQACIERLHLRSLCADPQEQFRELASGVRSCADWACMLRHVWVCTHEPAHVRAHASSCTNICLGAFRTCLCISSA